MGIVGVAKVQSANFHPQRKMSIGILVVSKKTKNKDWVRQEDLSFSHLCFLMLLFLVSMPPGRS